MHIWLDGLIQSILIQYILIQYILIQSILIQSKEWWWNTNSGFWFWFWFGGQRVYCYSWWRTKVGLYRYIQDLKLTHSLVLDSGLSQYKCCCLVMKRWTGWTRTRWSWTGSPWLERTPSRGRRSRIYWHSSRQNQGVEQSLVLTARNIVQKNNDKNNVGQAKNSAFQSSNRETLGQGFCNNKYIFFYYKRYFFWCAVFFVLFRSFL